MNTAPLHRTTMVAKPDIGAMTNREFLLHAFKGNQAADTCVLMVARVAEAYARYGGITVEEAEAYLQSCDDVVLLPGGGLTRKGSVVHIVAPQSRLSGRRLVNETRAALARFHEICPVLYSPIRADNHQAIRFAEHVGAVRYAATETHIWFKKERQNA